MCVSEGVARETDQSGNSRSPWANTDHSAKPFQECRETVKSNLDVKHVAERLTSSPSRRREERKEEERGGERRRGHPAGTHFIKQSVRASLGNRRRPVVYTVAANKRGV